MQQALSRHTQRSLEIIWILYISHSIFASHISCLCIPSRHCENTGRVQGTHIENGIQPILANPRAWLLGKDCMYFCPHCVHVARQRSRNLDVIPKVLAQPFGGDSKSYLGFCLPRKPSVGFSKLALVPDWHLLVSRSRSFDNTQQLGRFGRGM